MKVDLHKLRIDDTMLAAMREAAKAEGMDLASWRRNAYIKSLAAQGAAWRAER